VRTNGEDEKSPLTQKPYFTNLTEGKAYTRDGLRDNIIEIAKRAIDEVNPHKQTGAAVPKGVFYETVLIARSKNDAESILETIKNKIDEVYELKDGNIVWPEAGDASVTKGIMWNTFSSSKGTLDGVARGWRRFWRWKDNNFTYTNKGKIRIFYVVEKNADFGPFWTLHRYDLTLECRRYELTDSKKWDKAVETKKAAEVKAAEAEN